MWYHLLSSPQAAPELARSAQELLATTTRLLVLVVSAILCIAILVFFIAAPGIYGLQTTSLGLLALAPCLLALQLAPKRPVLASVLWLIGLAVTIVAAIHILGEPMIGLLLALFPLLAIVTLGWPAALLVQAGVMAAAALLTTSWLASPLPASLALGLTAAGAITLLLGWAATHTLVTVTQWSLHSYERANADAEEARNQRLELRQVQEDLVQANRELARLADRLKVMYQVAEEARRAKEEFVANVSHELRTPLNMIIGFSEVITRSPHIYGERLPPALLADITAIQRNSQHLARLVNDVLDLSQVDAGRMVLQREWAAPAQIVEDAAQAVEGLFRSKGLYLVTEIEPDLPLIFCDSTRIRQVLINLLSNAGRFTEQGGVRVCARRASDQVEVGVADTGPGIAEADQQKLFEPFQQLDGSIRRRHGGSGLGLAISKRLVEMHGGKITLASQVGVGTTITFSLPLDDPEARLGAGTSRHWANPYADLDYRLRTRPSKAPRSVAARRYLIVEQGRALQRLLTGYLPDSEAVGLSTLEEAWAELSRSPAAALVINAPPGSAMAAQAVPVSSRPDWQLTPVLTCWVPKESAVARQLGVVRYLIKPVSVEGLYAALASLGAEVKTVLVVDDQGEALQLFSRMLAAGERRYDVLQAKNGQRALSLMRQHRPDVVLLDIVMPGMDGFQVLQAKCNDPEIRDIPVVIISAQDPTGHPIVSDFLATTRAGGLSARELVACIAALSEILAPSVRSADPTRSGTPPA